jgi:hypothetical protein
VAGAFSGRRPRKEIAPLEREYRRRQLKPPATPPKKPKRRRTA